MTNDLFVAEVLYLIITLVSGLLVYEFYRSRNGKLRILMIVFWAVQAWTTGFSGFYFYMLEVKKVQLVSFGMGRMMALIPLAISMVLILVYVINSNRKKRKK